MIGLPMTMCPPPPAACHAQADRDRAQAVGDPSGLTPIWSSPLATLRRQLHATKSMSENH